MYEYYEYTGKKEFLEYVYPSIKNYLNLWQVNENGLMDCTVAYPIWEWGDSVASCDYQAIENAWYYFALSKIAQMAEALGYENEKLEFLEKMALLKTSYHQLWTENGYQSQNYEKPDERANAVAVIAGLADKDKYPVIKEILTNSYDSTVYMEKYILEALCKMGNIKEAQQRMEKRYNQMVNGEKACSTLWENWNYESGTKNHAWAGGPLIIMSKYFAGIEPLEKGYETISIEPQFGNLKKIEAAVSTIKGNIKLQAEKSENEVFLHMTVPAKTRVAIPKLKDDSQIIVNEKTVYKKGKPKKNRIAQYDYEDEKYFYFYVESGEYEIISK